MDIRIEKTEKAIKNAFLELRAKKPLEKITVKELCALYPAAPSGGYKENGGRGLCSCNDVLYRKLSGEPFHRKNPSDLSLRYSGQGGSSAYQKLTYYLPDPFSPSGGAVRCKVEKLCTKSKRSSCLSLRRLGGTGKGGRGNKWHGGRSYCAGLHWIYSGNEKNVRTKNR